MNLWNNPITRRWNTFLRKNIRVSRLKKAAGKKGLRSASILYNNCLGGVVLHELGLRFDTPTINLFFHSMDFFTFAEHLEHYLSADLTPCLHPLHQPEIEYPVMTLPGNETLPDLELHFLHYRSTEEAVSAWERRKARLDRNDLSLVWTFSFGTYTEADYARFEAIPIARKVAFVNRPVDTEKYPHLFYIKGFEKERSLGQIINYSGLFGKRYYDSFPWIDWLLQRSDENA